MANETYQERLQAEENVTSSRVESAVREAVRAYQRRAVVGFVILLAGLGGAVYLDAQHGDDARKAIAEQGDKQDAAIIRSGDAIAVSGCNRDYETIDALRDQLEVQLVRIDALEADGTYTTRQAEVGRQSTKDFLAKYKLPDCRHADDVLTQNPGESVPVIEPRYPDDPEQLADEKREEKDLGKKANVP